MIDKITFNAIAVLKNVTRAIDDITVNADKIDMQRLKPKILVLQNSLEALTKETDLGIIIQDEPGGESNRVLLPSESTSKESEKEYNECKQ